MFFFRQKSLPELQVIHSPHPHSAAGCCMPQCAKKLGLLSEVNHVNAVQPQRLRHFTCRLQLWQSRECRGSVSVCLCCPYMTDLFGNAQLQLGHCDQSSLDELPAKTDSYAENCMSRDVGLHRAQLSKHQLIKSDDQQMSSIPIWSRPMTWTLKIPSLAKRL